MTRTWRFATGGLFIRRLLFGRLSLGAHRRTEHQENKKHGPCKPPRTFHRCPSCTPRW